MRRFLAAMVVGSLLVTAACSRQQGSNLAEEEATAKNLTLSLCDVQSARFDDDTADGKPSVGDGFTYVIKVSTKSGPKACDVPQGQFFGVEEIVQEMPGDQGGKSFLTNFQGTFMLPDGNVQLRSMGYVSVQAAEMAQMKRSGPVAMGLGDLFPKQHEASVIGQGGSFTGYLGTAVLVPGQPPVAQIKLFKRF